MGIVVFGSVFVDIKGYPLGSFVPDGRNAGRIDVVHGGVSRNVAEDIANIGLRPSFISLADIGGTGDDVIKRLSDAGCDTRYMKRTSDGMGTWLAVFDSEGDVYASISKRPDLSPIGEILDEYGDEIFDEADSIILEMDMPGELVKRIFAMADEKGKKIYGIVSNISIAIENTDLIRRTGCFVCNAQEAGMFFGTDYDGMAPAEIASDLNRKIVEWEIPRMVVTLGADGAVYADHSGNYGICPAEKVRPVDTTGAGDAFFSGVAAGLTYGRSLAESCAIGTHLAAGAITSQESVCPRTDEYDFSMAE